MNSPQSSDPNANLLRKMYTLILQRLEINTEKWKAILNRHADSLSKGKDMTQKERIDAKGNAHKSLSKSKISIDKFQQGITMLSPVDADITVRLRMADGTVHTITSVLVDTGEPIERVLENEGELSPIDKYADEDTVERMASYIEKKRRARNRQIEEFIKTAKEEAEIKKAFGDSDNNE